MPRINARVEMQPKTPFWKSTLKFIAILFLLLVIIGLFVPASGKDCIGRIKMNGEIVYDAPSDMFGNSGGNTPAAINGLLLEADKSKNVKAILIEINSPGGSAVASKDIFDQVRELKKPTVGYFAEVAASGGYYVGAGTDYIIAHPNSITGSIGARGTFLNYEGLFEKLGIREESIKSGELKDIGIGSRNMTLKERKLLQELIDETFYNFRRDVEDGRKGKLNGDLYREALDARVLSSTQAKKIGLIDEVGNLKRAIKKANELAGNNETDEEKMLPICDFESPSGFNLFGGLSASIGKSFAKGFVSGINEEKTSAAIRYE
jgi:protease-4